MSNKREEITDLISSKAYADPNFKKGLALKFEETVIKVTRVDRKNKRCWGEHIELVSKRVFDTHRDHIIAIKGDMPFCTNCNVPVSQPSTEDGDVKALNRKDRMLSDGTEIE